MPCLREKNRYLAYKVNCKEKLEFSEVRKAVQKACFSFMGQLGMARAGVYVMNEWKNNKGIIKVNNKYLNELHASLVFVNKIKGKDVMIESIGVSGILKKTKEKFM